MDNSYIERLQKELNIYYRAFKEVTASIDKCHFKNNRQKNGLTALLRKFICAKNYEECIKIKNTVYKKYLKNENVTSYYTVSPYDITSKISKNDSYEEEKANSRIYEEIRKELDADTYIEQIYNIMSLYTNCLWHIKLAKKEQEEAKNKPKEKTITEPSPSTTPSRRQTYEYGYGNPNTRYTPVRDYTIPPKEEILYTEEECKIKVDTLLTDNLRYDEKHKLYKSLNKNIPGFYQSDLTDNYANGGTIDRCIEVENNIKSLNNPKDKSILDYITETAVNCFTIGKRYLMDDYVFNTESNNIMSKVKADKFLEQYTKAYNLYKTRYSKLSQKEKDIIMEEYKVSCARYKTMFGLSGYHIISPEELKERLNRTVTQECSKKPYEYVNKDHITPFRIRRRTTLMDELELVSFYKTIAYKKINDDNMNYSVNKSLYGEEEADIRYRSAREKMAIFQQNIVNEIIHKTSKYRVQNANLTEEEKLAQYEILQYKICKEYLGEEPLFEIRHKPVVKESHLKETIDSKKEAEKRFFGLSRLQKTMQQINGTWSKYQKIIAVEELTETQIEELNNMFKK